MEDENNVQFSLENANISCEALTLQELCERRKILLHKKIKILNKKPDHNKPILPIAKRQYENLTSVSPILITVSDSVLTPDEDLITLNDINVNVDHHNNLHFSLDDSVTDQNKPILPIVSTPCLKELEQERQYENLTSVSPILITVSDSVLTPDEDLITLNDINVNVDHHNNLDFSLDDSVTDPSFVALSEITNLKPLSPDSIEWFPERDIEEKSKKCNKRKKKAEPKNWRRIKNKRQRMMGEEYVGFKKEGTKYVQKELKPARAMGPLCMAMRCFSGKAMYCSKLTEKDRSEIFKAFWKMSWQEKKMYVSSMVDKKPTSRKTRSSNSRRSDTKIYYLKVNDKKERVCLKTFLGTLGIKEWTVRYWLGEKTNTTDPRETETRDVQVKESKKKIIQKYLIALPKLPSHYCRQSTSKLYLEPLIQSKSHLYRLYVDYSRSQNEPVASRKLFEDVLSQENIGIFQPKKDACDLCCAHKVGNISDEEYNKHIELKEVARAEKSTDKKAAQTGTIHTLTADLQAVKLCPFLKASAIYFKTKLAVHNFTVYNLGNNAATCYWFDETVCDLKATTFATFLVDYLTKLLDNDPKNVVLFTDGCTAQNRNNVVSNALLRLAMAKNVTITQKYLEKGHTQMEVDSVHSVIERKLKNREIFLPSQYHSITKEARSEPSPYEVVTPDYTFFKDFSTKHYQIYESIRPGRGPGDHCVVDVKALRYNPSGTIDYKLHYTHDFVTLPRRPKKVSSLIDSVPSLYGSRQAISKTKYDHLQELKSVIPRDCHNFYDNLPYNKIIIQ